METISPTRYPALSAILRRKHFKGHARSVLHVVAIWIKDENAVNALPVEKVLRPIVEYFQGAPGLQEEDKNKRVVAEKDVREHLLDERIRTDLEPCITKVLQSLRYSRHELYQLRKEDIRRLERAIQAVRDHFHVEIPLPVRMVPEADGNLKGVARRL